MAFNGFGRVIGAALLACGIHGVAAAQCGLSWQEFAEGLGDYSGTGSGVNTMINWTDPATGQPVIVVGGRFGFPGIGVVCDNIAMWDGKAWQPLGSGCTGGSSNDVRIILPYDDGSGPALLVGGRFTTAGGVPAANLAKWQNGQWSQFGGGAGNWINDLIMFDDGQGGGSALYAAGAFTTIGGVPAKRVAKWTGSAWQPLGTGANTSILDLEVFDADGPAGPNPPELYECGAGLVGGAQSDDLYTIKWNGTSWTAVQSLGGNYYGSAVAFGKHNPGGGERLYLLFSTQVTSTNPPIFEANIYVLNSAGKWTWLAYSPHPSAAGRLCSASLGDPSQPPALYMSGSFTSVVGLQGGNTVPAKYLVKLEPGTWSTWSPVDDDPGFSAGIGAMLTHDTGDGLGNHLLVGGHIHVAGDINEKMIADLVDTALPPGIDQQPSDASSGPGGTVGFHVVANSDLVSYRWRHDGVDLVDGLGVSGALTPDLTLTGVSASSAGSYDVVVANDCLVSVTSDPAILHFCAADVAPAFGGDGSIDIDDLFTVINSWGAGGGPADIVPPAGVDVDDLFAVINAWGQCP